eukprot:g416.t1
MSVTQNAFGVQLTNDSSIVSKASTVQFGYFPDPFVVNFAWVPGGANGDAAGSTASAPDDHAPGLQPNAHPRHCSSPRGDNGNSSGNGHHPNDRMTPPTARAPTSAGNRSSRLAPNLGGALGVKRRTPLIHRGYAIRYELVERAVLAFLKRCGDEKQEAQIVCLGAGFDTLFWRLRERLLSTTVPRPTPSRGGGKLPRKMRFLEIDFDEVQWRKRQILALKREEFGVSATSTPAAAAEAQTEFRHAFAACDLTDGAQLRAVLKQHGVFSGSSGTCTLFLSEVVLCYMPTAQADGVLRTIAQAYD